MMQRVLATAAVLVVATATAAWLMIRHTSTTTWEAQGSGAVTATATRFTALVSPQSGCTSGRVQAVQEPLVQLEKDRVVVTFRVADPVNLPPVAQNCQGAQPVAYEVVLTEPLRHRAVVDGGCRSAEVPASCVRVRAP